MIVNLASRQDNESREMGKLIPGPADFELFVPLYRSERPKRSQKALALNRCPDRL